MKNVLVRLVLVGAMGLSAALLSSCVEAPPPGTVYASYAPPAGEVDVAVGVAPGPDYLWIGGHHVWRGNAYVWQAGTLGAASPSERHVGPGSLETSHERLVLERRPLEVSGDPQREPSAVVSTP